MDITLITIFKSIYLRKDFVWSSNQFYHNQIIITSTLARTENITFSIISSQKSLVIHKLPSNPTDELFIKQTKISSLFA
ncbi:hypothetical protein CICLE_v10029724mg [Citrus x clementina]|uniref:Uncharacterized protein n=2 Tax=Citrus TaxID=2706 RepID=A0A067CZE8_CITSI|nr:hypothetical protein CICLE_v10029724mg [Citrus x clementina]KDO36084.1 hypothetical protein CISIN_1g034941mg [Citrus sinensis]